MATPAIDSSVLTRRGVLTATASSLLLSACGQGQPQDEAESSGSASPGGPELLIGVSLELTGRGAALGVLQERALRITLEALNVDRVQVGNQRRSVRVLVRDNRSDPRLAAQQTTDLIRTDRVHALLGTTLTETAMAVVGVAQRLQTPFVSVAPGDGIVLPLTQRTFIYKLTPDAVDVARRLARLISSRGLERVALLAADGLHGDSGVRAVAAALRTAGVELDRTVRLPRAGADAARAAREAVAGDPDGMVVWAGAPDSGSAARALRRARWRGPLFFDAAAVAEETVEGSNAAAVEGAYAVHPTCLTDSTSMGTTTAALARRELVFRYIHEYGGFSGFAPYASDALQLIADAARLAGSVDRGRLRAYLQTQVTEGMAGWYAFAPIRHGGMDRDSLGVYQLTQGSWTRVS
ncbi:branched-chain amino acid transport system substrate-binding protein [Micromonospora purpureochromogenes]|uniref:Branched-chain amino acid transport system substrate-binding protein n=1 Tax=Micromonospora purpureochromogenes TaxID=47872 RepID=A0A1C5AEM6_9ACTN|nr:ABC transporter substrate-binding protein [Micromonospora purpureochromogenes]SCF43678.1 branched-chain amino acid transport system substrate-binding protein [Micromonospora purpureochromogenes]